MKNLLLAFLCLACSQAFGQVEMIYKDGSAQFQKVIELDSQKATDIYKAATKWVMSVYKNPEAVIKGQLENEMIKGQGSDNVDMPGMIKISTPYRYSFRIDVKDGKARITISDFVIGSGPTYTAETYCVKNDGSWRTNVQATGIKSGLTEDANALFNSLQQYLSSQKKEEW